MAVVWGSAHYSIGRKRGCPPGRDEVVGSQARNARVTLSEVSMAGRQGCGVRNLFSGVKHPRRIGYFVLTSAILALGTAAVVPLLNVVFHEGNIHTEE